MSPYENIVILTGAGISAESGIATFRDTGGIWATVDPDDVATPQAFVREPAKVLEFYNTRRRRAASVEPNAAHLGLARLEREHRGSVWIVTQNIDTLHEAAGSRNLVHMHGQGNQVLCNHCGTRRPWGHNRPDLSVDTPCPSCNKRGGIRPDVVWFGEVPYHLERIGELLAAANLFVSIGTSGNVFPAASFVSFVRKGPARTIELNLEPSEGATHFHEAVHGPATEIVPAFVDRILAGQA